MTIFDESSALTFKKCFTIEDENGGGNIKADKRDSVLLGKNQGLPGKMKAILPPKYIQKKMDMILNKYI